MTARAHYRGGVPVGLLSELDPVEAGAVLYLRLWCGDDKDWAQKQGDFAAALGHGPGSRALESFETLCDLCVRHGRRPLMRHHPGCKCLGADESCFANIIAYASEGAREDALMLAATIVRPDMAPILAALAEEFGLALRRMTQARTAACPGAADRVWLN